MRQTTLLAVVISALLSGAAANGPAPQPHGDVRVVLPDTPRVATLYADGRRIVAPIDHVWHVMCFSSQPDTLAYTDLMRIALEDTFGDHPAARRDDAELPRAEDKDAGSPEDGGFNLVFHAGAGVPPEAEDALQRVRSFYHQQFSDNITVTINLEFDSLPGNVLGATGSTFTHVTWNTSRIGLQNGMDNSDYIQLFLPPQSTIPVRYNGESDHIVQETRVFWTLANFRATIGSISGDAADMRFNDNIQWDYDPDDGVSGYSFIDVVIHEVGHVLGFDSGADFLEQDMEALDIFRFQRTDGGAGHDYNPDTYAEFRDTPRTVSKNLPNNDVNSDLIFAQYKMADGFPYQASHFRDKTPPIGIMDPVLGEGETFAPSFFTIADKRMFDAIGWDR